MLPACTVMKKTLRHRRKNIREKEKKTVYRLPAGAAVCGFVVKVF
jgi:hypothetical protein